MTDNRIRPVFKFANVADEIKSEKKRRSLEMADRFIEYGTRQNVLRLIVLPETYAYFKAARVDYLVNETWPVLDPEPAFRPRPYIWKVLGLIAFEMDFKPSDSFIKAAIIAAHHKLQKIKPKRVAPLLPDLGKSMVEKLCALARVIKTHPRINKVPKDDLPLELLAMTDSKRLLTLCMIDYRNTDIKGVVNIPASACQKFGFSRYRIVQALASERIERTIERYLFKDFEFKDGGIISRSERSPDTRALFASTYVKKTLPEWLKRGWGDSVRLVVLVGAPDPIKPKIKDGFAPSKAEIAEALNLEYLDKHKVA